MNIDNALMLSMSIIGLGCVGMAVLAGILYKLDANKHSTQDHKHA